MVSQEALDNLLQLTKELYALALVGDWESVEALYPQQEALAYGIGDALEQTQQGQLAQIVAMMRRIEELADTFKNELAQEFASLKKSAQFQNAYLQNT